MREPSLHGSHANHGFHRDIDPDFNRDDDSDGHPNRDEHAVCYHHANDHGDTGSGADAERDTHTG